MDTKRFFTGRTLGFIVVVVIVLGVVGYQSYFSPEKEKSGGEQVVTETVVAGAEPVSFVWKFEEDDSLNLDGLPQTNVALAVTYSDDSIRTFAIETVPGSCNALPDSDSDSIAGISDIQCYAAGFGQRYKIIKNETAYQVQRKYFEEASPDYEPPVDEYTTILTIPFVAAE